MKLCQTYLSPFPTRVRLAIYAKGLDVELVEPPGFHDSGEAKGDYLLINPIGRVPALVLGDGRVLPESEVICEYLEEVFPQPPLMPADPWGRAKCRLLSRICDFYLVMAMVPLFNVVGRPRRTWDPSKIAAALAEVETALGYLEFHIGEDGYAVGERLSLADGAIVPQLVLAYEWAPRLFRSESPLGKHPKLAGYWRAIQADPLAGRVIGETRDAIAASVERALQRANR